MPYFAVCLTNTVIASSKSIPFSESFTTHKPLCIHNT